MKKIQQLKIIDRHPIWMYSLPSIAKHIFKPLSQDTYQQPVFGNQGFIMDTPHFPICFPQAYETNDNEINAGQSLTLTQKLEKAYKSTADIHQELGVLKNLLSTPRNAKFDDSDDQVDSSNESAPKNDDIAGCINKLDA